MTEDVNCPISVADRKRLLADDPAGLSDALRHALTSAESATDLKNSRATNPSFRSGS